MHRGLAPFPRRLRRDLLHVCLAAGLETVPNGSRESNSYALRHGYFGPGNPPDHEHR